MRVGVQVPVKQTKLTLLWGAAALALAFPLPAGAQEAATGRPTATTKDIAVLEEVTVTARRVTENLQAVPIAITAVTNEDIGNFDIRSVTDLQRIVPSLTATGRLGQNEESLTLRGQRATGEFIGAGAGPAA